MDLRKFSRQSAGFSISDLNSVTTYAYYEALQRSLGITTDVSVLKDAGVLILEEDMEKAISKVRGNVADKIGAPKIPNVQWEDIGGLGHVKDTILETIELPLKHPELFTKGVKKRSGVLLYGPPGTGKTLVAKAVATTLKLNFFSVKGPELLDMYIGESEANVRRVFEKARDCKPCVIFFDELDSVAPKRGDKNDAGGVMDRIVSQILAELDSIDDQVFCIGATNRPDLLDAALLRPGRFDKLLYLGVFDKSESKLSLLNALTRKFKLDPNIELIEIAKKCPENLTGADFYALCSDAMLKCISRLIKNVDEKLAFWNSVEHEGYPFPTSSVYYLEHIAKDEEKDVVLTNDDFMLALGQLEPSVSMKELERYRKIREEFEPELVPKVVGKGKGKAKEQ